MSAHDENPPGHPPVNPAEPRRLLDDADLGGAEPSAAWALGLLRGAEPYRAPAGRKQRVQLRLGHAPRRTAPLVLRLAVMAFVLCGFAAVVSAALGHWPDWMALAYERVVGEPPAGRAPVLARARAARHASSSSALAPSSALASPAESVVAEESPAPSVVPAPSGVSAPAERRASHDTIAAPRARHPAATPAPPTSEDASAVAAAMRALRVEKDPARARGLLSRYLAEHPNGALAEEALAMSIEAAIAHHDTDVTALASRYLRLYPHGSFQSLARNALVAQQSQPASDDKRAP
jgi:hypothetical protein